MTTQHDQKKMLDSVIPVHCSDVENIDPDGDVILLVKGQGSTVSQRFLVSSKVLSLASPVFKKLFGPNFSEGNQLMNQKQPEITLHEDDPATMSILLAILHHQDHQDLLKVDKQRLAFLAVHCDKYDCARPLTGWTDYWFGEFEPISLIECASGYKPTSKEYGLLLLASHYLRASDYFRIYFCEAQKNLTPNFATDWREVEVLNMMPEVIEHDLSDRIRDLNDRVHNELQSVESHLRADQRSYTMEGWLCMSCNRTLQIDTKECQHCGGITLHQRYCTADTRISEFFAVLSNNDLWPSLTPFQTCSLRELFVRLKAASRNHDHSCACGKRCPLILGMRVMVKRIEAILRLVHGTALYPLA